MLNKTARCFVVAFLAVSQMDLPAQAFVAAPQSPDIVASEIVLARAGRRHHHAGRPVVVVRPWRRRPHYGRIIAGVVLGSIVVAAVAGSAPPPPAPNLCWRWTNNTYTQGYWDYCR